MLGVSELCGQVFFVAMIATFMGICWSKVAATQFAVYMSLANLGRSASAGLFAALAASVSSVDALYLMAGLYAGAALLLWFFNPEQHGARMAKLQS